MGNFLAMGGYAAYVWPAYAVFLVVLAIDALAPIAHRRRVLSDIRGRVQRRSARNVATDGQP